MLVGHTGAVVTLKLQHYIEKKFVNCCIPDLAGIHVNTCMAIHWYCPHPILFVLPLCNSVQIPVHVRLNSFVHTYTHTCTQLGWKIIETKARHKILFEYQVDFLLQQVVLEDSCCLFSTNLKQPPKSKSYKVICHYWEQKRYLHVHIYIS